MKWHKIDKGLTKQPSRGTYLDWKPLLRREAKRQCVYCCISEKSFGGLRNFHVEHYRPKSRFQNKENLYKNLFYACAICNTFKGADWPGVPKTNFSNVSYPDPSLVDYCEIFIVSDNQLVDGKNVAAKYIIQKLHLNRLQLIFERRESTAFELFKKIKNGSKFMQQKKDLLKLVRKGDEGALKCLEKIFEIENKILELIEKNRDTAPYDFSDVRKK